MDLPRASAIASNISAFLLDMGRAGGGDDRTDDDIQWTVGGSPLAYHNAVVRCAAAAPRADHLIEDWADELRSRQLAGSWHLSPMMTPADLPDRLEARGFTETGDEPAMAADLAAIPESPSTSALAIQRVADKRGLAAYRSILSQGFGEGPREADWVTEIWRRIGLRGRSRWRHYVGRSDGEPVSAASLFIRDGVGGIYFVATAPYARNRGFGAAITRHAMDEARADHCALAVLGASDMGYSIYRRLGFEEIFRYRLYEYAPAG